MTYNIGGFVYNKISQWQVPSIMIPWYCNLSPFWSDDEINIHIWLKKCICFMPWMFENLYFLLSVYNASRTVCPCLIDSSKLGLHYLPSIKRNVWQLQTETIGSTWVLQSCNIFGKSRVPRQLIPSVYNCSNINGSFSRYVQACFCAIGTSAQAMNGNTRRDTRGE